MSSFKRAAALVFSIAAAAIMLGGCSAGYDKRMDEALASPPGGAGEPEVMRVLNATANRDYRDLSGDEMSDVAGFVIFDELWSDGAPADETDEAESEAPKTEEELLIEEAKAEAGIEDEDAEAVAQTNINAVSHYRYLLNSIENGFDAEALDSDSELKASVNDELGALSKMTDTPKNVLRGLIYLKYYCRNNSASDALDVLESYLHSSEMNEARREAYESLYLRMLVGSLGDNTAYDEGLDSFETVYNEYIDIGVEGFEGRAFAELQTCPDPEVATEFLDFLLDNDRSGEITSDLLVSASLYRNYDGSQYEDLPDFDYDEIDALAQKLEAAVAEPTEPETEEEGLL